MQLGKLYCASMEYHLDGLQELQKVFILFICYSFPLFNEALFLQAMKIFESMKPGREAKWATKMEVECQAVIAEVKVPVAEDGSC